MPPIVVQRERLFIKVDVDADNIPFAHRRAAAVLKLMLMLLGLLQRCGHVRQRVVAADALRPRAQVNADAVVVLPNRVTEAVTPVKYETYNNVVAIVVAAIAYPASSVAVEVELKVVPPGDEQRVAHRRLPPANLARPVVRLLGQRVARDGAAAVEELQATKGTLHKFELLLMVLLAGKEVRRRQCRRGPSSSPSSSSLEDGRWVDEDAAGGVSEVHAGGLGYERRVEDPSRHRRLTLSGEAAAIRRRSAHRAKTQKML